MLSPLMRLFGLNPDVAFLWLVGNTVGLAYGSAIMMDYAKMGKLGHQEADLLNHHLAISHSQLEDPLLFAVMGLPARWLIFPRVGYGRSVDSSGHLFIAGACTPTGKS